MSRSQRNGTCSNTAEEPGGAFFIWFHIRTDAGGRNGSRLDVVEVIIMIGFGIAGYLMRKVDLDPAPLVLAFVLGNIFETNFRQALLVGKGTLSLFYSRPIAAALIACSVALIAVQVGRAIAPKRSS